MVNEQYLYKAALVEQNDLNLSDILVPEICVCFVVCFFVFFVFLFIKISKFALPRVMLKSERSQYDRKKDK